MTVTLLAFIFWILFGTAIFTSFIWLVIVAFRESVLWGFLVLFLSPFTTVIFAIKNWSEAKKPFLIHIISISGFVSLLFYLLIGLGGLQMLEGIYEVTRKGISQEEKGKKIDQLLDQIQNTRSLNPEEKEKFLKIRQTLEEIIKSLTKTKEKKLRKTPTEIVEIPPGQPKQENKNKNQPLAQIKTFFSEEYATLEEVPLTKAYKKIGETFRVKGKDGLIMDGQLTQIKKRILVFKKASDQGSLEFEMGFDEISSLQVYQ